ncbi:MAG: hypothetical protein QOD81_4655 [Solirubrobacteraceae bacterium]|nr:hypothetical protein [Solirubrobacteraceae bacterium]
MGRRSRKERPTGAPPSPDGAESMRRGYARAEERNAAVRAGLRPIGPTERPAALTVAVALATALAVGNLAAYVAGVEVDGRRPGVGGVLFFALLMLSAAWGMWRRHYWAVLGFEALLGITIGIAGLSLLVASNVSALVLCAVILVGGGVLFWKLIRVMARIQASHRLS